MRTPLSEQVEVVEAQPLMKRRKLLGLVIPVFNLSLFALNVYTTVQHYLEGVPLNSQDFLNDVLITILTLSMGLFLPWFFPVYTSTYILDKDGLRLKRFLKRDIKIPYRNITRVEAYIRELGDIPDDALKYAKDQSARLSKAGVKFVDYTNTESNIVLVLSRNKAYMISPTKPRGFLKSLKKRTPKMTGRIVELHSKGKIIQELE